MATNKQLQAQLEKLEKLLAQHSITDVIQPVTDPTERADYIAFGSPKHAALLGLVEVKDIAWAKEAGYVIHTSPETGKVYRLMDELGAATLNPTYEPQVAAKMILRQKVSTFESGPPKAPEDAPPMWKPRDYVPA